MWQKKWIDKVTKSRVLNEPSLNLVSVGFSGVHFALGRRLKNLLELCFKLEIWYVSTRTNVISENTPFSTKNPLILLISTFFAKNQHFLVKNSTFTESNGMRAVLEVFQFYFQFL